MYMFLSYAVLRTICCAVLRKRRAQNEERLPCGSLSLEVIGRYDYLTISLAW